MKTIQPQSTNSNHAVLNPLALLGFAAMLISSIGPEFILAQSALQPPGTPPGPSVANSDPDRAHSISRQSAGLGPKGKAISLRANRHYGQLPLGFEPDHRQAANDGHFVARGKGYSLETSASDAVVSFGRQNQKRPWSAGPFDEATDNRHLRGANGNGTRNVLRINLESANPNAKALGLEELPGKANYLIGNDPKQWRTSVPTYARVKYEDVYPGVDLVYYGNEGGQLEYDFVVAPGADPGAIRLNLLRQEEGSQQKAEGSERKAARKWLRIDRAGNLVVSLGDGEVRFVKPIVYQEQSTVESQESRVANPDRFGEPHTTDDEPGTAATRHSPLVTRHYVNGRFVIDRHHAVKFQVAAYDRSRPLVIDPSLTYSTYLGGDQADVGNGIAVDSQGNTYIAGQTCSPAVPAYPNGGFPTQNPLAQDQANGINVGANCDAFVSKLNPDGTALLYSTYLGGSSGDSAAGIAIDAAGDAYVTGFTNSTDFPTTPGVFQPAYGGGNSDDFVAELNPSGTALVYSSYLGGNDSEGSGGIAVDAQGNAYITGETFSFNFPTTPGAFQTVYAGNKDAFVTKVNAGGAKLGYSSYLGSDGGDSGTSIAVDSLGAAFVTGSTFSDDSSFPVTRTNVQGACGGYQRNSTPPDPPKPPNCPPYVLGTAYFDAFVTKVSPDGSFLVYSTYLGGSKNDVGTAIALDTLGAAYVAGWTDSSDFPPGQNGTAGLQTSYAGGTDAFVAKIDAVGSLLSYSTYLGGSGQDIATAIAVDANGVAYVTGGTASADFPTVSAIQPSLAGPLVFPGDAFVSKINAFGSGLIYSSYLGGGNLDEGNGIAVDSSLGVYITGSTSSSDFPITSGSFQTTGGVAGDAFVTKFDALTAAIAEVSPRSLTFPPQGLGIPSAPQTVTITNSGDADLLISAIVETGDIYTPPPNPNPQNPIDLKDWDVTTDNCTGILVAPGSNCTFTVTFVPNPTPYPNGLGPGQRTGTITLTDNATSPTQVINLSGQGVAPPAVTLLPTNLSFANQLSGTTSPPQTVTVSNSGGFVLAISSISVTPPFSETNTCGTSLGPGGNCTISVTFSPTTSGPVTGTVSINDDATGSPQTVNLAGTGTAPVVTLSATSLAFTSQPVNTSSASQSFTLTNSGTAALNISGITLIGANSSDYSLTPVSTCGVSVTAGASCTINVTFNPTAAGIRVAVLNIADNAQGSPQQVALSGEAILAPNVTLSDTNLNFSPQNVGTTSSTQTVTLTNTGSANLEITATTATGNFAQTNNCFATVTVGASCSINVTFTPSAPGNLYGAVTITDNAANSPQTIVLGGIGTAVPVATLSSAGLSFSGQALDTSSSPQSVTLTNTGTAALSISDVALSGANSGDFALTSSCGGSLDPGANCTLTVTFTPTADGARVAVVNVTDNAQGSPQSVALTGNGVPIPIVTLSPVSLTFTNQNQGTVSAPQTITLTNSGTAPLGITNSATTGDFAQTNNCPASLGVGGKCQISVTFTPTATGNRYGALAITNNAAGSPQSVPLAGVGVAAPVVSLSTASLTFTNQPLNNTSGPQNVILTNIGAAPLAITSISAGGADGSDFALSQNCGGSVAATGSCVISVTFTPTEAGTRVALINIADNAQASPQTIALTGTSVAAPVVTLSATALTFAGQNQNTTSGSQKVTVTNTGTGPLNITNAVTTGDFAQTNNCPASIAVGASCVVSVTFTPTATGNRYGTVAITDNAVAASQTILLTGVGLPGPLVSLSAPSLTFATQPVNTTGSPQNVTLTNAGTAPLAITSIGLGGANSPDFALQQNCGASVAAAASCVISVTFTPSAGGTRVAVASITDNAQASPQTIALTGTGVTAPVATLSASTLTFAGQNQGTTSAAQTVTVKNTGTGPLNITNSATTGDFAQTNNCPASLAVGASCTFNVTFVLTALPPTTPGNQYGTVTLTDNATNSPQTVLLSGLVVAAPVVSLSASNLTFGVQSVGGASTPQPVTLTNSGSATLNITSISLSAQNFTEVNACPASLTPGNNCVLNLTFAPTTGGTQTATLTIADNTASSPQTITMAGTGADFSIVATPSSATVSSGATAIYNVTVTPQSGFTGTVTFSCSHLPSNATCTASPATVTANGSAPMTAAISVNTASSASASPRGGPSGALRWRGLPPQAWLAALVLLSALLLAGAPRGKRLRAQLTLAAILLFLLSWMACGGSGNGSISGAFDPAGTSKGTYSITINGASGTVVHSASVTLVVQ